MSSSESPNWSPSADVITLPKREQFDSSEQLLETLIHELAHSTGHPSRLNRAELLSNYSTHRASRGEEELIADMTAAMVASHLGVDINLENTAAYVQSWLKSLQNDRSFILKAATSASKAMDYMLGNTPNRGTNKPESSSDTPAPNTPDADFKQALPSGPDSPSNTPSIRESTKFYENTWMNGDKDYRPVIFMKDGTSVSGIRISAGDDSLILEIGTSTKPREISYDDISEITISPLPVSVESSEEDKKDLEVAPPPPSYKPTPIDIKTSAEFYEDTWMNGREGYKVIVFMKDGTQRDARRFSTNQDGVSLERGTSARPVEVSYDDIKDITILPEANLGNYGKTGEEIAKEKEGEAK